MKNFLIFIVFFLSCSGGIDVRDFITETPDGGAAIPLKLTNKNWTTCKKHYFESDGDYIFDDFGNAIYQIICINLYDDKKYVVPADKWNDGISAHFIWVSIAQLKQWIEDKEIIAEKTSLYADNVPEALTALEEFLHE